MKTLYIISGCNGAGKTTASITMLPEIWKCREFVNADEIAKGLSPYNPEGVAIEAGRFYMDIVDEWLLVDNYSIPRAIIASGGKTNPIKIVDNKLFNKVKSYVRQRI